MEKKEPEIKIKGFSEPHKKEMGQLKLIGRQQAMKVLAIMGITGVEAEKKANNFAERIIRVDAAEHYHTSHKNLVDVMRRDTEIRGPAYFLGHNRYMFDDNQEENVNPDKHYLNLTYKSMSGADAKCLVPIAQENYAKVPLKKKIIMHWAASYMDMERPGNMSAHIDNNGEPDKMHLADAMLEEAISHFTEPEEGKREIDKSIHMLTAHVLGNHELNAPPLKEEQKKDMWHSFKLDTFTSRMSPNLFKYKQASYLAKISGMLKERCADESADKTFLKFLLKKEKLKEAVEHTLREKAKDVDHRQLGEEAKKLLDKSLQEPEAPKEEQPQPTKRMTGIRM